MTRLEALPAHVDPSIVYISDGFLGLGALGYTICYVLMTRQSIRDGTYAMPLFSLAFNFAWEIVFGLFVAMEIEHKLVFIIWMVIDLGLVYTVVVYGANEWKHAPAIGRNIGKIFAGMLAWWCAALYALSTWWLSVENPINPKAGKAYRGVDGIDADELSFWTVLAAQVVLSVASLGQIMARQSTRGSSYGIWTTRFLGSYTHPLAVLMMVTWVVADLGYLALFCKLQPAQAIDSSWVRVIGSEPPPPSCHGRVSCDWLSIQGRLR